MNCCDCGKIGISIIVHKYYLDLKPFGIDHRIQLQDRMEEGMMRMKIFEYLIFGKGVQIRRLEGIAAAGDALPVVVEVVRMNCHD